MTSDVPTGSPRPQGARPEDGRGSPRGNAPVRRHDAVVLAGGGARRLGGADKPAVTVGGRPLLDRVLSACADATATVVVGPRRPTPRPVTWVREEPPGGGPLAALDAGLRHTTEPLVLVLSADLPFLREETVRTLLAGVDAEPGPWPGGGGAERAQSAARAADAARAEDAGDELAGCEGALVDDGRDQPLLAAYRAESLRRELALLHTEYGSLHGLPLRLLLPELRLRRVRASSDTSDALDCDTWDDVAAARARIRERDTVLDEWMTAAKAELGVELDVDTAMLLDLARDAAHGVARPAAPLTTFLVGYAAAMRGGSAQDVAEASRKAVQLAARWAAEAEEAGPAGEADGGR
ncbi:molybdenum cofactor guanylyltransferase [Streptomyces sp. WMMB 714]|uniref:NTP transferase domain-containing protein n=1 Tax=Streptomyces sp. WMMB 714 TaxID=1286822 RepID=UPI00082382F4|nr:NTP transferase domain-containing protein [Streptomyces sp. WMMB 714]SCK23482.1 molybdenum cofactor guanylyltransferase [Streptomyces sp. WMMB 714]